MRKHWKWILPVVFLAAIVVYLLPPSAGEVEKRFSEKDFRRYDLFIEESDLHKMDSLAKPLYDDFTGSKEWFKAKVVDAGDTIETNIRLKGDKPDHYDSELLSWRLKYKVGDEKRVFSLQHPKTRKYIAEWMFHQLLKQEGLPYLDYYFVVVHVNGQFKGLYAEEEHFSNHNIEAKWGRPHGPIMRFDDEKYWPLGLYPPTPTFDSDTYAEAEINSLNYSKSERKTPVYKKAEELLKNYRDGKLSVDQIFDLELMAKYYAITDLVGGHHALRWINCRYYYNPETNLFEPAGFDANATRINDLAPVDERLNKAHHSKLVSDPEFQKHYQHYLKKYSKKQFIDDFLQKHNDEITRYLEAFNDQFGEDKNSLKRDLYLNQWVIFYHLRKRVIYSVLVVLLGFLIFRRFRKKKKASA